jgi:N-acetyl-anhydromuramyl-L-alanine amidase AmpD
VCSLFAGAGAPRASAHYSVDSDSTIQMVKDKDVAWHAPGANNDGIGIEHAGYARSSARDWDDEFSANMLKRSAELTAALCRKYDIPILWLSPADLRAQRRGITSHNNVSDAFHESVHWDPGPNFPSGFYVSVVRDCLGARALGGKAIRDPMPTVRLGGKGWAVKRAQKRLKIHGMAPGPIDGIFGALTDRATRGFQNRWGLSVDGIVGPKTWAALLGEPRSH